MGRHVGVLRGGRSQEREISLVTGGEASRALGDLGYDVSEYDTDRTSLAALLAHPPECVFVALHGRWGEDGTAQGFLELAGIPYTGSGVLASALAMSKVRSKRLFDSSGIPTPAWVVATKETDPAEVVESVDVPLVVKPSDEGSAIGVSIVREKAALSEALQVALGLCGEALVEEFIPGVELTVAVLGNDPPEALPVIEIVPKNGWYDFEAKYTPGMSKHIIPARIPEAQLAEAGNWAVAAHEALGCRDLSRVDMIMAEDGALHVLEVNTIPGLTPTSLFPDAAAAAGISFGDLCDRLVRMALARAGR